MHVLTNTYFLNNKNHNWCARGSLGYFLRYIAQFPILGISPWVCWGSQIALVVKNLPANAGDTRDVRSIPGLGRSPGVGNGNLLQYSCLENSVDRRAWWATVQGMSKSQTQLSDWTHTHTHIRSLSGFIIIIFSRLPSSTKMQQEFLIRGTSQL